MSRPYTMVIPTIVHYKIREAAVKVPVVTTCLTMACVFVRATMIPTTIPVPGSALSHSHHTMSALTTSSTAYGWTTSVTHLPRALSRPAVAVGKDGRIYVFGGGTGDNHDYATTYIYTPATNKWTLDAPMPVAREGAQAVTLPDGRIAVLGGGTDCAYSSLCSRGTVYDRVDVYNPATHAWSRLAPMLSPRYRFAAVARAGRVYAIGGSNGTTALAAVESYNPSTNRWTAATPLPHAAEALMAVTDANGVIDAVGGFAGNLPGYIKLPTYTNAYAFDGHVWHPNPPLLEGATDGGAVLGPAKRVYVVGGYNNAAISTVQVYDPVAERWSYGPSLPRPTALMGVVATPDGHIYALGGGSTQVAIFGPQRAPVVSWDTTLAHAPEPLSRPAVALGRDGRIYAFGGYDTTVLATTYIYDPATNRWTRGASMRVAREGGRAVTLPDGRIAVLGGGIGCADNLCTTGTVYDRADVYTPSSNSWAKLAPMPHPRYRFAAVPRDGRIYAIGGSNGAAALSSVEAYNPASNSWTAVANLPRPLEGSAAAVESNGTIDVVGGLDGGAGGVNATNAAYATLFSFDGHAWHPSPPLLRGTEDAAATLGPDGQVYVAGGFDNAWLTTVQRYDPVAERWSLGPSLPSPRCCMGMVTARDGRIYVVGGGESRGNTIAVYRPRHAGRTQ